MVFLKEFFEKVDFEKNQQTTKKHEKLPRRQIVNMVNIYEMTLSVKLCFSYDIASGSDITPCIKIDKPLVVYRFSGNVMK